MRRSISAFWLISAAVVMVAAAAVLWSFATFGMRARFVGSVRSDGRLVNGSPSLPGWLNEALPAKWTKHLIEVSELHYCGSAPHVPPFVGLARFPEVQTLHLIDTTIPDDEYWVFGHLQGLTGLRTVNCRFTDAAIDHFVALPALRVLNLDSPLLTDAGINRIKRSPILESIGLRKSLITDAGLRHLAAMPNLQSLWLEHTAITDAGLAHLKAATKLRRLNISYTKISDEGLEHLLFVPSLGELDLSGTSVTDKGIEKLKGLPHLQRLTIHRTAISEAMVRELRSAISGIVISGP